MPHEVERDSQDIRDVITELEERTLPNLAESKQEDLPKIPFDSPDVDLELLLELPLKEWVTLKDFNNVQSLNLGGGNGRILLLNQSGEEWVDYKRHHHKKYEEEVIVIQGELICEMTGRIYRKGQGVYRIPEGMTHHPKITPNSVIAIIFKKV